MNRVASFKQWSTVICTGQSMMLKANVCLNQDIRNMNDYNSIHKIVPLQYSTICRQYIGFQGNCVEHHVHFYFTYNSISSTAIFIRDMLWNKHILSSRSSVVEVLRVLVKNGGLCSEQHVLLE